MWAREAIAIEIPILVAVEGKLVEYVKTTESLAQSEAHNSLIISAYVFMDLKYM